ncbi:MAG: hypothetical protein FVQ80_11185 [Planctomycetes bacterium]|nr:hypothetical protein [Planctomycetota bacterium]
MTGFDYISNLEKIEHGVLEKTDDGYKTYCGKTIKEKDCKNVYIPFVNPAGINCKTCQKTEVFKKKSGSYSAHDWSDKNKWMNCMVVLAKKFIPAPKKGVYYIDGKIVTIK